MSLNNAGSAATAASTPRTPARRPASAAPARTAQARPSAAPARPPVAQPAASARPATAPQAPTSARPATAPQAPTSARSSAAPQAPTGPRPAAERLITRDSVQVANFNPREGRSRPMPNFNAWAELPGRLVQAGCGTFSRDDIRGETLVRRADCARIVAGAGDSDLIRAQPHVAASVRNLDEPHRRMYAATLGHIEYEQQHGRSGSDYQARVMQSAADIAGGDRARFVELVGFAMNDGRGFSEDFARAGNAAGRLVGLEGVGSTISREGFGLFRGLAGGRYSLPGSTLETTYERTLEGQERLAGRGTRATEDVQAGYSSAVQEAPRSRHNSITHHFGEFMTMGYNRQQGWAAAAQDGLDRPEVNPGDNRSGHFAGMLGAALRSGQITNQQAVDLTRYAYAAGPQESPMWPRERVAASQNWNVQDWLEAMRTGRATHSRGEVQAQQSREALLLAASQSFGI